MKSTTDRLPRRGTASLAPDQAPIPEDEAYWREYLGEFLDKDETRWLLGLERQQELDELVAAANILAVPTSGGTAFPTFQFVGGRVDPTVSRVIQIFSGVVATPYTTASWLRGARFDDKSVLDWLARGGNPEIVIQAAEDSAARLAA